MSQKDDPQLLPYCRFYQLRPQAPVSIDIFQTEMTDYTLFYCHVPLPTHAFRFLL